MDEEHNFSERRKRTSENGDYVLYSERIEPWRDEPGSLPLHLLKTESSKFQTKPKKLRRGVSLEISLKSISISPRKQRASRMLPKMDIGSFVKTKPSLSLDRNKQQVIKRVRKSESSLPTLAVCRELMIERKLYLMNKGESESPSPRKKTVRELVDKKLLQ